VLASGERVFFSYDDHRIGLSEERVTGR
jgi:hypothetical protein